MKSRLVLLLLLLFLHLVPQIKENWFSTALVISRHYEIPRCQTSAAQKTKATGGLMPGSGAQMFDRLPGRGAKPRLSPDTERLPCAEEGGKIAFHGFRQIIEFKSPVYNSSWSQRILPIYLRSHFPLFFTLTMTDYNIAPRLLLGAVAIPHNGSCQVQQSRPGAGLLRSMRFGGRIGHPSTNLSLEEKKVLRTEPRENEAVHFGETQTCDISNFCWGKEIHVLSEAQMWSLLRKPLKAWRSERAVRCLTFTSGNLWEGHFFSNPHVVMSGYFSCQGILVWKVKSSGSKNIEPFVFFASRTRTSWTDPSSHRFSDFIEQAVTFLQWTGGNGVVIQP